MLSRRYEEAIFEDGGGSRETLTSSSSARSDGIKISKTRILAQKRNREEFEKVMGNSIKNYRAGEIDKDTFIAGAKEVMWLYHTRAYNNGLKSISKKSFIDAEGFEAIENNVLRQMKYVNNYATQIEQNTAVFPDKLRVKMYANQLDASFTYGSLERVEGALIYWHLGEAEHCQDCLDLAANSPYSKETLPTVPRRGDTICLTNCKCHLDISSKKKNLFHRTLKVILDKVKKAKEKFKLRLVKA